jgi:hypothetical protein
VEAGEPLAQVAGMRRHGGEIAAEPLPKRLDCGAEIGLAARIELLVGGHALEQVVEARCVRCRERVVVVSPGAAH